nr:2-oxoacid:acceptor oxidoreductase family protein [Pseudoflavonifractor sp. An85]
METNLCVAGFGGQGVMTLGKFLASATCDATDKNVTFFPSYGAEQRGGTANCFVVISDGMIGTPLGDVMDDLIVMNGPSLKKFLPTLKENGTLFINSSIVDENEIDRTDVKVVKAPVTEMALEMGNAKVSTSSCWACMWVTPKWCPPTWCGTPSSTSWARSPSCCP